MKSEYPKRSYVVAIYVHKDWHITKKQDEQGGNVGFLMSVANVTTFNEKKNALTTINSVIKGHFISETFENKAHFDMLKTF